MMLNQVSRSLNLIIRNGSFASRISLSPIYKTQQCSQRFETLLAHHETRSMNIQSPQQINYIKISHQYSPSAYMSYDSSNKVHSRIHDLITKSKKRVFVFMKGVPSQPLCGFSGAVVQILKAYEIDFDSCDVLENLEIKNEIKTYSDWPTIPQVYIDGNFIGGCDILLEMHQSGELAKTFAAGSKEDQQKPVK